MKLDYIVSHDRQNPTAWVIYDNPAPLAGTSTGAIPVTDEAIIAKFDELHELVAATLGLTRTAPPVVDESAVSDPAV